MHAIRIADWATGYSPLDFSVLDPHWGNLDDWKYVIDEIHKRDMYYMADFTVGTMSDLIGFKGCVVVCFPHVSQLIGSQVHEHEYALLARRIRLCVEAPAIYALGL